MLYREIIAVCSQIHTKHINTLCGRPTEPRRLSLCISSAQALPVTWYSDGSDLEQCCLLWGGGNAVWSGRNLQTFQKHLPEYAASHARRRRCECTDRFYLHTVKHVEASVFMNL